MCGLFGKSRQAYYQRVKYEYKEGLKNEILYQIILRKRQQMKTSRIGGRKLYKALQGIVPAELLMGRDAFFGFLKESGFLVRNRKYRPKTTDSYHRYRKYPNLIRDFIPTGPNQLWVSDITYVDTAEGFVYLSLITDAYSRKILGWAVGETLEAKHTIMALKMALKQLPQNYKGVFHHSDRGSQYCCDDYIKILNKHHFEISMTEKGDPLENAIAERVNGILKMEWLYQMKFQSLDHVKSEVKDIIHIYNTMRFHSSIAMMTPTEAHKCQGDLTRHWKNYYKQKKEKELFSSFVVPNKTMAIH
jgi:putative transposase